MSHRTPTPNQNCHAVSRDTLRCCPVTRRYLSTHINGVERVTPRDRMLHAETVNPPMSGKVEPTTKKIGGTNVSIGYGIHDLLTNLPSGACQERSAIGGAR